MDYINAPVLAPRSLAPSLHLVLLLITYALRRLGHGLARCGCMTPTSGVAPTFSIAVARGANDGDDTTGIERTDLASTGTLDYRVIVSARHDTNKQ